MAKVVLGRNAGEVTAIMANSPRVAEVRDFHTAIATHYPEPVYVHYADDIRMRAWGSIHWAGGDLPASNINPLGAQITKDNGKGKITLNLGGAPVELKIAGPDAPGDETVPAISGRAPGLTAVAGNFVQGDQGAGAHAGTNRKGKPTKGYDRQGKLQRCACAVGHLLWNRQDCTEGGLGVRLVTAGTMLLFGLAAVAGAGQHVYAEERGMSAGEATHCLGRYLVDLPRGASVTAKYTFADAAVQTFSGVDDEGFCARVHAREVELKQSPHATDGSLFVGRESFDDHNVSLASWQGRNSQRVYQYDMFSHVPQRGVLYRLEGKGNATAQARSAASQFQRELLQGSLRYRPPGEVPEAPGFCIDSGFIARSKLNKEKVAADIFPAGVSGRHHHLHVVHEGKAGSGTARACLVDPARI
ncbi:hypothetical protein [Luteimonas terrae]|uniref:Tle cognate immunity protein 4 N-terminal domain-containing protein n=1 Tax=Luteimonas terrae TaxID=1530191 RepID=A0ABU1XV53_9GAMM|nr:hypothetical protein [Luteimonas terrae]MDR7192631.1 hypothetical protein [Luteimonas terrae]